MPCYNNLCLTKKHTAQRGVAQPKGARSAELHRAKQSQFYIYYEVWLSLVERYVRDVEVASSNLVTSTNKKGTFVYQKFLFCLSKPQVWHIITTQSWISSAPLGCISSRVSVHFFLRLDDIQCFALMICNSLRN